MIRARLRSVVLPLFAAVALLAAASPVQAQRARNAKATKVAKPGATETHWSANGVHFSHRTYGAGKQKLGWERRSTTDKNPNYATTKLTGKVWGSKLEGTEHTFGKTYASDITATSKSGQTRRTMTMGTKGGTETKQINMKEEGKIRKITSWTAGSTRMTVTRDYKAKNPGQLGSFQTEGRPLKVERRGEKLK